MNNLRTLVTAPLGHLKAIREELRSLGRPGPRLVDEIECVLSVLLAIVFAHWLGAQYVGWAAFSGYAVMRSRLSESMVRGTLRIVGTAAGALVALLLAPAILASPALIALTLAMIGGITLYFALVGRHSYAWLFTGLTFCMILIEGMKAPTQTVAPFAQSRVVEIIAGTLACILVSIASNLTVRRAIRREGREIGPAGQRLPYMRWHKGAAFHAGQAALALAFLPFIWLWTGFGALSQSSVTIMVVMLLPIAALEASALRPVTSRMLMRFAGCLVGGIIAIAVLFSSHHSPLLMTIALCIAVIVGRHVENGNPATSYLGIQFALAFLVVLVPDDYLNAQPDPGVSRLAGILLGILMLEPILIGWYILFSRNTKAAAAVGAGAEDVPRE